jgi:hypothetical protein
MDAASANDLFGIQLGTGDTAPDISDYQLTTKISHGTGSGQLSYGAVTIGTVAIIGSMAKITISRPFTNDSGNTIDVAEAGLVMAFKDTVPNTFYVLIEHCLQTFSIANGLSGTGTYSLSVSV